MWIACNCQCHEFDTQQVLPTELVMCEHLLHCLSKNKLKLFPTAL